MYQDGYSSYFFNENFYKAAQEMDQAGDMHFVLGTAWELDSWMDVDKTLEKAAATKKYETAHIKTNWLKMFMDGTVESGTGFIDPMYPDGHQGIPNWSEEELTDITRKANAKGINISSHSDFPALSGSPDDPFSIMEIVLTGIYHKENAQPWWPEELLTREQALTAMTINCAKQMFLENERGSVSVGKYADFLLVTKDVLTCPVTEIHEAKPAATYFEGKKVFPLNIED